MDAFEYVLPKNVEDAAKALAQGGVAKAGGVDLLDRMKEGVSRPDRVVSLSHLRSAKRPAIEVDATGARISAFTTLAELATHEGLAKRYPALVHAAANAATPNIRNVATVAGNLLQEPRCWYYRLAEFDCLRKGGDGCPAIEGENQFHAILGYGACAAVHASNLALPLVALGAAVEIAGANAARRIEELWPESTATEAFHALAPGEIVTAVVLPPAGPNSYVEIRHKQSFDWALASAAVARTADGAWRVVLGGVAPVPWRAKDAEKALGRGSPNDAKINAAAEASVKGAKPLSGNGYKTNLAKVAVRRALAEATGGAK